MGFDTFRFIREVDEEFLCGICMLVLENPVQTPCEHNFCENCISEWLAVKQTCPVDCEPLFQLDFKPLNRSFRNLWNKLELTCDFQTGGCDEVVRLEHLQDHLTTCGFYTITCDKGCNLQMYRHECQANDCFNHFNEHVRKYENQLSPEIRLVLQNQRVYIDSLVNIYEEENRKLAEDNVKIQEVRTEVLNLQVQLKNLTLISKSQYTPIIQWHNCSNMNIDKDLPNILEQQDIMKPSFTQLSSCLQPKNNSFKVEILAGSKIDIGLACRGYGFGIGPYIAFESEGNLWSDRLRVSKQPLIVEGDIVECGIKFPENYVENRKKDATVYFIINGQFFVEKIMRMPKNGFFPTISFRCGETDIKTKIKYLSI